jgi:putative hydrolases of HD superfamily
MDKNNLEKLVSFFYEIGTLRKVARSHQQMLLFQDPTDNIASHSFRTAFIGYFLAKELKADADKVMKMCFLHDIEEARTGDQNWVHKKYIKSFEHEVREEQIESIDNVREIKELSREYNERKTIEAKIAKDADLLDQTFLLREYEWQGSKEAAKWLHHGEKNASEQEKLMFTDLAKKVSEEAKKQNPSDWWDNFWTSKRRN